MARDRLCQLLLSAFSEDELIRFISDEYPEVRTSIPIVGTSLEHTIYEFVEALYRRGILEESLFEHILTARPSLAERINDIRDAAVKQTYDSGDAKLRQQLEQLYEKRDQLQASGYDTSDVGREIVARKRKLRKGPQLIHGDRLGGRYKLQWRKGAGGFGTVWVAFDVLKRRHVAVKVLHHHFTRGGVESERFFRGARAMHLLDHQNIVKVFDPIGADGGYRFLVMELVRGKNLAEKLATEEVSNDTLLDWIEQAAEGLSVAHKHVTTIIHRDVKPENILVCSHSGVVKITDFDLADIANSTGGTRSGALGTFMYAAPEVLNDSSCSTTSADVYGLAMTAVTGLRGAMPSFDEKVQPAKLLKGVELRESILAVLRKSLQHDPAKRQSDAARFLDELKAARRCRDTCSPSSNVPADVRLKPHLQKLNASSEDNLDSINRSVSRTKSSSTADGVSYVQSGTLFSTTSPLVSIHFDEDRDPSSYGHPVVALASTVRLGTTVIALIAIILMGSSVLFDSCVRWTESAPSSDQDARTAPEENQQTGQDRPGIDHAISNNPVVQALRYIKCFHSLASGTVLKVEAHL